MGGGNSTPTSSEIDKLASQKIVPELECPICMDYMHPPITQCSTGHTMCTSCTLKLINCPICKGPFSNTRNFALEKLHEVVKFPCKFEDRGCKYLDKWNELQNHLNYCQFGNMACFVNNCEWNGPKNDILKHLNEEHGEKIIIKNASLVRWENFKNSFKVLKQQSWCLNVDSKTFVHAYQIQYRKLAQWAVYLVGPPEEAKKYEFELNFLNPIKPEDKLTIKQTCQSVKNETSHVKYFNFNKGIIMKKEMFLSYCCEDGCLEYTIKVLRK